MSVPHAILLDMDGTLTEPLLDFDAIRREMGIGRRPILEAMAEMDPQRLQMAEAVLLRHEQQAAAHSTLNPGCHELLQLIRSCRLPTALITRNSRASTDTVLRRHGLAFDVLITREHGKFKPDPAPLYSACTHLGVPCTATWMVGDGQYDIEAGLAAGAATIWISHGRSRPFAAEPWQTVCNLIELTELLQTCLSR